MSKRNTGIAVLLVVLAAFLGWRLMPTTGEARAHAKAPEAVPVTTAIARTRDMPVFLDGLGTVQALNTVQIKAQVSGTLIALPAHEGQEVHIGDVIAEIDPRPYQAALDQATAQRDEDIAQLQGAQLDLHRYQSLARSSFAPVQQVEDQQATVNKEIAAIAADTAMIETARINLGYCVIRAPIDGRVSLYQVDVGNFVQLAAEGGIVSITQDKPIAVVFTLPEDDLTQVQDARAHGAPPVLVASNDDEKVLATGSLLTPNNTIDITTGTISLKAIFDNQDDHLWPGQFVETRVQVKTLRGAVTIPALAVQHGPDGTFVYVVKPDQTVAQADVTAGYQDDGRVVIDKGITANQTVILSGQSRLSPGSHIKVIDASNAAPPSVRQSAGGAQPG